MRGFTTDGLKTPMDLGRGTLFVEVFDHEFEIYLILEGLGRYKDNGK